MVSQGLIKSYCTPKRTTQRLGYTACAKSCKATRFAGSFFCLSAHFYPAGQQIQCIGNIFDAQILNFENS
ncbi:hypothetical protein M23134_02675 [Microscilla marina ATCC 23134]|uniref:Uncharacterized protein n=1 Tax=Microscilla marina ATCC 23134 TaxID=313606 RepID=A1ZNW7_MICM2|nr:hypothetical protein M23134_02675 [Microscilla marina ATCC 23134]